jgi:thiol-disulfide isomerase/thioredoxin
MKAFNSAAIGLLLVLLACTVKSQPTTNDATTAWVQLQQATVMPGIPKGQTPTREEISKLYMDHFSAFADKARAFYTQFPDSTNAIPAKKLECTMLRSELNFSVNEDARQSAFTAMAAAQDALLTDSRLTDDQRFDVRVQIAESKRSDPKKNWQQRDAEFESAIRQLIKDYPQKDQPYDMLLTLGAESSDDKARSIATEVLADPVSDSVKQRANAILNRLNAVGKPLDLKFTALDGREVDLSQMKGKVVLIDFWATWCGPCVGEIPHVKETYDKLHSKGFEIVGISFDSNENALRKFVSDRALPWPQYFDGQTWQNKFGVQYAIESIPTMWLVDKKGDLSDSNARDDLQGRVEKLLAE